MSAEMLREFYSTFGMPGEGPPENCDLTELFGAEFVVQPDDVDEMRDLLANDAIKDDVHHLRAAMEEVANAASSRQVELLEFLSSRYDDLRLDPEQIENGIFWYGQASAADPRVSGAGGCGSIWAT